MFTFISISHDFTILPLSLVFNPLTNPALATDLLPPSLDAGCAEEGVCWGALCHWGRPCMDPSPSSTHTDLTKRHWHTSVCPLTCAAGCFTRLGEPPQEGAGSSFYTELLGKDCEGHKCSLLIPDLTYLLSQMPEIEWKEMWLIQSQFSKYLAFANITKIYNHVNTGEGPPYGLERAHLETWASLSSWSAFFPLFF